MVMNCPYCAKEMKKGAITQTDLFHPLTWIPKDRIVGVKALFLKQGIKLTSASNPDLAAYYCEDCEKFIINREDISV